VTFEWIEDEDDPYFVNCPQSQTLYTSQNDCSALASWASPIVVDNCSGQVNLTVTTSTNTNVINYGTISTALFQKGVNVVTYTATDGANNIATCVFTITVIDTVKPIITGCPTAIYANTLPGTCSATVTWNQATIIPSDNCPGVSLSTNYTPGSVFTSGITYVTYTATDSVGLQTFCTFAVHVVDNQLPTITCATPAANYVADLGECHYTHAGTSLDPIATSDNCGVDYVINNFNQSSTLNGAMFPVGTTTVIWTVYDVNGNTASCNQVIEVLDTQLPTIACPQNISVDSDPEVCGAEVMFQVTADDNCPNYIVTQTAGIASGMTFPVGTTTNVFVVVDASGNSAACSFDVTVTDVEYPTISGIPADFNVNNDLGLCSAVVTWTAPTADDNCAVDTLYSTHPSGFAFPVGTTTVTYTAIDVNGLITTASFDVTVTDNEYPVISGKPGNFFYQNDPGLCTGVVTWNAPQATDNCGIQSFTSNYVSGFAFPVGTTTVTYTAVDIYGHITTASFNVTIVDTEKPQIVGMPANITVNNDPEMCSAEVMWVLPTATDNCGVDTLYSNYSSGAIFPVGTTTVVYTAVDIHNNMQTASFTITVIDNEAPVILNIPADITVSNDQGVCEAEVYWNEPTADDNCQILTFTSNYEPGDIFPVGTTTVVYTATDIHSNVTTASFTITVEDNEAPVITLLGDATVEICEGETYTDAGATALDNCDGNITAWIVTVNPVNTAIPGTYTITYDVEDLSGNDAIQVTRTVIVHALPVVTAATLQYQTDPTGWMPVNGDLLNGYDLCIDPMEPYYYLDINTFTTTQPLAATSFTQNAFYLDVTSVPANYYTYWAAKGVVNGATGWQGIMWNIINGNAPMFYINYTGQDYQLIDGLQYLAGSGQNPLRVNGEYPQGSYVFTGTVEDVNGCTSLPFDVMIDFNTIPYVVPVSDQVFCSGETVPATILAGTVPGTTFAWTNSNTSIGLAASGTGDIPSFIANNNGTTNGVAVITVTPTASGCIGAPVALYTITVNELPAAPVSGGDQTICEEAYLQTLTATATAPAGAHIVWYNAATGGNVVQSQTLSVVGTVTYWAESVNHVTNCVSAVRTPVTLTINPAPAAPVSGGNQVVCETTPIQTLTATASAPAGVSVVWYNAATGGNVVQNPSWSNIGSVTYWAEAVNMTTNCISLTRTPVLLQIDEAPAATIAYPGSPFCSNEMVGTVVRIGTPNGTYFAFQPGIVIDPLTGDINIQASVPGQYTIGYVMPGNGACPPTVTTTSVYIEQIPQATISYPGTPFCYNGGSIMPTVVGTQGGLFSYYQWPKLDLNTITGEILLNGASDPGTYTVFYSFAATAACPQVNTSTIVQVLPQIIISGVAKDVTCIGAADGEIELTITGATAPLNYAWAGPTVIGNVEDPIGLLAGNYSVTVTDANNCAVTYSITVGTVPDVTLPVITCPVDITQPADAGVCYAAINITAATATDNCLVSSVTGLRSDAMLLTDPYPVGVTTITWTAIDNSGNSAVCLQTVTVNDEENPVLACPADIYQTADAGMCSALITVGATASDNCGVPTVVGVRSDQLPLTAAYPVGTTYIVWTATDGANNTDTCTQMIVVTDDENPVITCPADINITADEEMCSAEISIMPATATDNCSAVGAASNLTITGVRSDALALTAPYPVGTTTITWTAVDLAMNSAVCVQTIVVTDDEDPMISCPNDIYQSADNGLCSAVVTITNATATDNCLVASVTGVRSDALALNAAYPVGTTTITWTALDVAGNSDVCTQLVVITDDEDPMITCPANIAQSADVGLCSAVITIVPATATDNCNVASVTGYRSDQMALTAAYPVGTTTIQWVAMDAAGNSAVCSQTILVTDDEDPVITCPADINTVADQGMCSASFVNPTNNMLLFYATATDNCNVASVNGVRSDMLALTAPYPVGTTTITWTAIDDAGNSDVCVQTIVIADNQNPDITCPADITVNNAAGLCESLVTITPAAATDNCAISSVIGVRSDAMALNAAYPVGITTITWTATDIHNNMATCVQTITVLDVELPVINCEPNIVVTFDYDACEATVLVTPPTATDNCGIASVIGYRNDQLAVNDPYPVGLTTITWVATDVNGNYQTCIQTVKVNPYQVIVNYTFNSATLYPINPDEVAFGLTSYATSFEPFLLSDGTVTGPQAFVSDNTIVGNNALSMAQSNGNNIRYFEFQVTGDSLYRYRDFQLHLQGKRQVNAATKITAFYSLDGLNFLKADSLMLPAADTWFEGKLDISDLDTIDYAPLLYFRFYVSGTNVITGNTRLDIDNLQLVAIYGPLARPDFVTVPMNGSITIPVLNNDYYGCDGPDAIFPIIGVDVANNGTSTHNPNGTITYVPDPNYVGPDFFTYRITDANGRSDTAIVKVIVIPTSFVLNAKVLLQGPFDPNTGLMWDSLRANGYLPATEPYTAHSAFTHAGFGGGETVTGSGVFAVTGQNAIVDWVFVEFRDKNNPTVTIQSKAALLQRDGDIVDVDGVSPLVVNGILDPQVYVSIRHRNHMGVMTAAPVTLSNIVTPLDFTNGSVAEFNYGIQGAYDYTTLAQKDLTLNKRGLHAGNAYQDGKVKYQGANSDRSAMIAELLNYPGNTLNEYNYNFATGYLNGDVDMNGQLKYQGAGSDRNVLLNVILYYVPGATDSFDFMIEQLP
jgi:surface antigen